MKKWIIYYNNKKRNKNSKKEADNNRKKKQNSKRHKKGKHLKKIWRKNAQIKMGKPHPRKKTIYNLPHPTLQLFHVILSQCFFVARSRMISLQPFFERPIARKSLHNSSAERVCIRCISLLGQNNFMRAYFSCMPAPASSPWTISWGLVSCTCVGFGVAALVQHQNFSPDIGWAGWCHGRRPAPLR